MPEFEIFSNESFEKFKSYFYTQKENHTLYDGSIVFLVKTRPVNSEFVYHDNPNHLYLKEKLCEMTGGSYNVEVKCEMTDGRFDPNSVDCMQLKFTPGRPLPSYKIIDLSN